MSKCELKDILHEDIEDIIIQLEDSFGITFDDDAFKEVQTFGDLISVIENNCIHPIIPYFRSQTHWLILWHEKTR